MIIRVIKLVRISFSFHNIVHAETVNPHSTNSTKRLGHRTCMTIQFEEMRYLLTFSTKLKFNMTKGLDFILSFIMCKPNYMYCI